MKKLLLVLSAAIITVISCSKKMDPVVPVPPEALKSITLSKDSLDMFVGDTKQLSFTLSPSDFTVKSLVFTSSDSTTVSVSNVGLLTAKKPGLTVITVASQTGTISVNCLVSVALKPVIPPVDSLKVGLLAYYPFNFDSAVDSSGNGNDGTIYNITSVPDRFGNVNSAYYFNGTDGSIDVKDKASLRLSNTDFTLNTWVNLDNYDSSYGSFVMSKRTAGLSDGWGSSITGYAFQSSGQGAVGLAFFGPGGNNFTSISKSSVTLSKWAMITTTYSISKQEVRFYINGVLDNIVDNIPPPNSQITADMYIGSDNPNSPSTGYFLKGKIDDIRIYSRILSTATIQKLYKLTY